MNAEWKPAEETPAPEQERPTGPGTRLREAREKRGLSLSQVADNLKLKKSIIDALEADDYRRLPSILFARGYLRSYARLLELPVEEVIAEFEQLGLVEEQPAMPKGAILTHRRRGEHLLLRWGSVVVFLVLGALLVAWFQGESTSSLLARLGLNGGGSSSELSQSSRVELPAQPADGAPRNEVAKLPLTPSEPPQTPAPASSASEASEASETETPSTPSPDTTTQPPSVAQETPMAMQPPPAPVVETPVPPVPTVSIAQPEERGEEMLQSSAQPDKAVPDADAASTKTGDVALPRDRLVLELLADSWAEVTDTTGERLIYQLLKAGGVYAVSGQGPFDVFLGNAPGVELSFNGEPVTDIRANSRGVARFTLGGATTGERQR